mmetsp:Transcript_14854/g.25314  ORF Transcript_14854/g.25314 Transcript_14854/m.25314 type:complete len:290 (-) Transcript_14854:454-1323(-)
MQLWFVRAQQAQTALVRGRDDRVRLGIDELRRLLREGLVQRVVVILEGERPHRGRHAVRGHHTVSHARHAFEVVLCTRADLREDNLLRCTATQRHAHRVSELIFGEQWHVTRQRLRIAERGLATRHDRYFHHRVGVLEHPAHEGVPCLMESDHTTLVRVNHQILLLQACYHSIHCRVKVHVRDRAGTASRSNQRSLVAHVGQLCAREAGGERRDLLGEKLRVPFELDGGEVDPQDLGPAANVGFINRYLPVEAAGPQQRVVEDVRPIGTREHHDARRGVEAIHLDQKLV